MRRNVITVLATLCALAGGLVFASAPALAAEPETPETLAANPVTATTATLNGVLNPGTLLDPPQSGTYEFLYKASETECTEGETAPKPADIAAGLGPEPKSQLVTGLLPDTTYTFCLLARNAAEETARGPAVTFTTPAEAPVISSEVVTSVESTGATLNAQIDPGGASTTYHFEYLTEAQFKANGGTFSGAAITPESPPVGADNTEHPAEAALKGLLQPGTTYHYRAVATNSQSPVGGTPGTDKTLTTPALPSSAPENCSNAQRRAEQPYGLGLPDCRAYEQVSPVDKNDNDIMLPGNGGEAEDLARASVSGEAITYDSFGSFAEPVGARYLSRYVSRRGAGGWSTQNITPPYSAHRTSVEAPYWSLVFTPDLSMGVVVNGEPPLTSHAPAGCQNLYLADVATGSYQLADGGLCDGGFGPNEPEVEGASTDLSHIVFTPYGGGPLYEWVGGQLSLVSVANDGTHISPAAGGQHNNGDAEVITFEDRWHAVSDDGLRVFFTDMEGGTADYGQLYVRENPEQLQSKLGLQGECTESGKACTVEVSASQRTTADPHGPRPAEYLGASADGSKVFFDSRAELTEDANTGKAGKEDSAANLYEYDLEKPVGERLTDLTVDAGEPEGAAVLGMVTAGEDGSYVYYVADGVLASGATPGNCAAHPNESPPGATCNLYVQHYNGTEWTPPAFIATLAGGDAEDWLKSGLIAGFGVGGLANNTARITPDGTHLAFLSEKSLTGYDNTDANTGKADQEVFSYDATQPVSPDNPVCVSCNPSGARPVGPSRLSEIENSASPFYYTPRNFSEDGSRLFFDSRDALVPHDSNGRQDVYEYEGGHVYLISNGAGNYDSSFLDASPSGDDVFIGTADQLLPQDTDFRIDVYDARVDGGFPVSVSAPACDNGDSCKGPVSPQPAIFGAPASATFSGAGNLAPGVAATPAVKPKTGTKQARCKKGFVKKRGRCVKEKQAKKKKRASKSSARSKRGRK